jgi:EmrB/QacA subfamily drug resistance transporter
VSAAPGTASGSALPRWRVFPALALGTLMAVLDISVVNIALPTLSRTFGAPLTSIEWVVLAYVLTISGLLLTMGRVADLLGRRRVYGAGQVLFTVASALCAAAPSAHLLIAARALQGLGAAMMTANSSALLISSFGPEERGRALGAFGAMVGVGLALGPALGGIIVGHLSWRWIFLINVPIGLVAQWQLWSRVPADEPGHRTSLSLPAAVLWSGALVCLMLALSRGPAHGWGDTRVWPLLAAAVALFAGFAWDEARSEHPLLPLDLLRGPLGVATTLTALSSGLGIAVGFHLPLYLEDVVGLNAEITGRWLAIMPLLALVLAPLAGRWSDRLGARRLSVAGTLVMAVGFGVLSRLGVPTHPGHVPGAVIAGIVLIGFGMGIFSVPNSSAALGSVPPQRLGLASGLQATMRNLGISAGAAAMAALVATRYAAHGGGTLAASVAGQARPAAFALATRDGYVAMTAVAIVTVLVALRQKDEPTGSAVPSIGAGSAG